MQSDLTDVPDRDALVGMALIDGAFINTDLNVGSRTRRDYVAKGILPPPDTNLRGRDLWLVSTYRRFKARLLAGEYALDKRSHFPDPGVDA